MPTHLHQDILELAPIRMPRPSGLLVMDKRLKLGPRHHRHKHRDNSGILHMPHRRANSYLLFPFEKSDELFFAIKHISVVKMKITLTFRCLVAFPVLILLLFHAQTICYYLFLNMGSFNVNGPSESCMKHISCSDFFRTLRITICMILMFVPHYDIFSLALLIKPLIAF